jgi:ABC-type dipeptide/oligopeptide/nickel transport system permease subunit
MAQTAESTGAAIPLRREATWLQTSALGRLLRIKLAVFGLTVVTISVLAAVLGPVLAPYGPTEFAGDSAEQPFTTSRILGTDILGRDQLTRLLYGARASLQVGLSAVAIGFSVGTSVGLSAAYFKGAVDSVLMRIVDAMLSLPGLVLPLTLLAALGGGINTVSLALGIAFIPGIARLMRGQAFAQLERDYVLAAIAAGASTRRIMFRHVAPNTMAPIIVAASLGMSVAVIAEAGLSFLGVGVTPPTATWGTMLSLGFQNIRTQPWLVFAPASSIFLLVISINFIGDGLRDVLDPRLRGGI